MGNFVESRTWFGIAEKTGGTLFVVGMEDTTGMFFNIGNPTARSGFGITSVRLGAGLGGGIGLVAVCVFNCDNIWQLNNTQNNDWGVNISLGGQWAKIAKTLKNAHFFTRVARVGAKLTRLVPTAVEEFRNDMHYLYTAFDIGSMDNSPKVVSIDTPIGVGLEVSINYTIGKIEIF